MKKHLVFPLLFAIAATFTTSAQTGAPLSFGSDFGIVSNGYHDHGDRRDHCDCDKCSKPKKHQKNKGCNNRGNHHGRHKNGKGCSCDHHHCDGDDRYRHDDDHYGRNRRDDDRYYGQDDRDRSDDGYSRNNRPEQRNPVVTSGSRNRPTAKPVHTRSGAKKKQSAPRPRPGN